MIFKNLSKTIKFQLLIFFYVFCFLNNEAYSLSIPEGIRGFASTYGTLIETILSRSPLKGILYPENREQYERFQRMILVSERMSEEGNDTEALSYLKKADFYLKDIFNALSRQYGWTKEDYSGEETESWSNNVKEIWATHQLFEISLQLQYEYYYALTSNPAGLYYKYIEKADLILQKMNKKTGAYRQIQNSYMARYIQEVKNSWDKSLATGQTPSLDKITESLLSADEKLVTLKGYWPVKFLKRSIIILSRFGYPQSAWYFYSHLAKEDPDVLPVRATLNLMVYNSKFEKAGTYLQDKINLLKLDDPNNWGTYLNYEKYYLNFLLFTQQYEQYAIAGKNQISQIRTFLKKEDLTSDVYEFLAYRLNEAILNYHGVENYLNAKNDFKNSLPQTRISLFAKNLVSEEVNLKLNLIESYHNPEINFKNGNIFTQYRTLQKDIRSGNARQAHSIFINMQKTAPGHYLTLLSSLRYSLMNPNASAGKKYWYDLWMNCIYASLNHPDLLTSLNSGIVIYFNYEKEFFSFFKSNPHLFNVEELTNILYALSMVSTWENKMMYPPEYYDAVELKARYAYLTQWGFAFSQEEFVPTETVFQAKNFKNKISCQSEHSCWVLYPGSESVYSIVIGQSAVKSFVTVEHAQKGIELVNQFYQAVDKGSNYEEIMASLGAMSDYFLPILSQLNASVPGKKIIRLITYKNAHLYPLEALLFKKSFISDKIKILRRLPLDQPYSSECKDLSCRQAGEERTVRHDENNYFVGVGNISPGFILSNPNQDELMDIEGLFAAKKLIPESGDISTGIISTLQSAANFILHIAGEWNISENFPVLDFNSKSTIPLNNFRYISKIPYLVISKNKSSNFSGSKYMVWEKILTTFRYKNTGIFITSMAPPPKEFRQAFFYDLYYRIEHKNSDWIEAFFAALERTKKGFPNSIWPHLMVIYEK